MTIDKRRGRSRPERASVSVSAETLAKLDAEAARRGVTRYELTNQILGQFADELGAELPATDGSEEQDVELILAEWLADFDASTEVGRVARCVLPLLKERKALIAARRSERWIKGPPPGRGRWWVVWRTRDGAGVEAIELSPALVQGDDPDAPLLIKTMTGLAFRFDAYRDALTHHMPLTEPEMPNV